MDYLKDIQDMVREILTMGALIEEYDITEQELAQNLVRSKLLNLYPDAAKPSYDFGAIQANLQQILHQYDNIAKEWYNRTVLELRQEHSAIRTTFEAFSNIAEECSKIEAVYNILVKSNGFVDDPDDEESQEGYERALDLLRLRRDTAAKQLLGFKSHWSTSEEEE